MKFYESFFYLVSLTSIIDVYEDLTIVYSNSSTSKHK